ncbi:MAG: pseudouridine synthase [Methylobacillus glycogenes]|nr:pseudouridine synthase [Methylobacillus glycogenes]
MATLKLPSNTVKKTSADKAPVRRADPSKRDRTQAPVFKKHPAAGQEQAAAKPKADTPSAPGAQPAREPRASRADDRPARGRPAHADGRERGERTERRGEAGQTRASARSNSRDESRPARSPDGERGRSGPRNAERTSDRGDSRSRDSSRRDGYSRDDRSRDDRSRDDRNQTRAGRDDRSARSAPRKDFAAKPAPAAGKPPATGDDSLPRLSKRMAELGLCSRREADEFIVNGWVTVDGVVVDVLGSRVPLTAEIQVSKEAQKHQSGIVTILLHKPVGYVSGQAEDGYQPAIVLVHPDNQWTEDPSQNIFQRGHLRGLAPAGRLDIDSTGLLVLTQDGRVARQLIGEDSEVEKEYLVRVEGELSEDGLRKLNHGLTLDGVKLKPARVSWQNEDQLRFVLREGRKRQIRRMCEMVGLTVVGLKRVRIGSISLGKLPVGTWRYLRPGERF